MDKMQAERFIRSAFCMSKPQVRRMVGFYNIEAFLLSLLTIQSAILTDYDICSSGVTMLYIDRIL